MPATDPVDVANAALTSCGVSPIASFAEDSDAARFIDSNYEFIVTNELSLQRWLFNRKQAELSRLAATPVDTKYEAAYQLPADLVDLRKVTVRGYSLDYDKVADTVQCDASEDDTVVATYGYRIDEAGWPAHFRMLIVLRLAAMISAGFTEQPTRADVFTKSAEDQLIRARYTDSAQETTDRIPIGDRLHSRRRHSGNY